MRRPKTMTSQTHPLYIGMVDIGPGFGRVGLTLCPGKKDVRSPLGRVWDRDLAADMAVISEAGATVLLTLVETWELQHLKVQNLGTVAEKVGLRWIHLPILDMGVPDQYWERIWAGGVGQDLRRVLLDEAGTVVVHCRGGLGRAGTVACRLLVDCGWHPSDALRMVREVREGAVENEVQEAYVTAMIPTTG